jgi:UDP-N-acetylglucosamine--N-acetylmuramyl-(pentapeptide) pyrophosphoryl-undecaprenol N-acetylglucosamine transferase
MNSKSSLAVIDVAPNMPTSQMSQVNNERKTSLGKHVVLATGGTGGHIYPAIAVAEELKARGYGVTFIGQRNGLEANLVPQAGFNFVAVTAGKLDRQRPNPFEAIKAIWGCLQALQHVARLRPTWVVGFGGFASFPALAAAWVLRRPLALHEANAYPGLVTKLFARTARFVASTEAAVSNRLSRLSKVTLPVGLPIRLTQIDKAAARAQLGLPEDALITLVMGGSQGAKVLNEVVPAAYEDLESIDQPHYVLHSAGRGRVDSVTCLTNSKHYRVMEFVDAPLAWSAADIAITRAGSSTLAEAAFYGVPLIMVPFAAASENHQFHNAKAVEADGAGYVIEEHLLYAQLDVLQLDAPRLAESVSIYPEPLVERWQQLLAANVRNDVAERALLRAQPEAAKHFVDALEQVAPTSSKSSVAGTPS